MRAPVLVLLLVLLPLGAARAAPEAGSAVRPLDLDRLRELYRLTDRFGEALWPGFDARTVPISLLHEDRWELLVQHPHPPDVFRPLPGVDLDGVTVLVREGTDRFGPGSGGVAADLYGTYAVTMNTLGPGNTTQNFLSVLLHECFHVYQRRYREPITRQRSALPEHDAAYSALVGLERRVLHAAVQASDEAEVRELARTFLAVRRERRVGLDERVVRAEDDGEYDEGTATYVQVRLLGLLAAGDYEPGIEDPRYDGFRSAAAERERMLARIAPRGASPIRFHLAKYQTGMAQCLLLDRLRPGWKREMAAKGSTLTGLLALRLPLTDAEVPRLAAAARARFDHAALLAEQTRLVERDLARIRGYVSGPGRRYRIHTGLAGGTPRSKMRGPAYRVPPSLVPGRGPVTVWAQGGEVHAAGLSLVTKRVPVVRHPGFVEWIDRAPRPDGRDLEHSYDRVSGGVYEGLRVTTDGFTLTVDRARVERTPDLVTIRPVPPQRH